MKLLDLLSKGIVIGDGAVGTLLHSHGLQSSFEELNVSDPDLIISIHKQYVGWSRCNSNEYVWSK